MVSIAHILNPFTAPARSDLAIAMPITFESMRIAKKMAADKVKVDLLSVQFAEDRHMIPEGFTACPDLQQSVLDYADFQHPTRLPLISDILNSAIQNSDAEYIIYTNVDIGLQPEFYLKVAEFISAGHDAFIINRRRISSHFRYVDQLPEIRTEKGKAHPGFDCFVFHRSLFPKFILQNICIGVPFIEITLSQNLFAFARNFHLYDNEFITFHIGMEIFRKRAPREYLDFNRNEYRKAISILWTKLDVRKFPYADRPLPLRLLKWGLHPCIPIKEALRLELERMKRKK